MKSGLESALNCYLRGSCLGGSNVCQLLCAEHLYSVHVGGTLGHVSILCLPVVKRQQG